MFEQSTWGLASAEFSVLPSLRSSAIPGARPRGSALFPLSAPGSPCADVSSRARHSWGPGPWGPGPVGRLRRLLGIQGSSQMPLLREAFADCPIEDPLSYYSVLLFCPIIILMKLKNKLHKYNNSLLIE